MLPQASSVAAEVECLADARAAIDEARAASRAALRYERRRLKRTLLRGDVEDSHLSPALWSVLLLLFYFAGYDSAAAVEHWQLYRRTRQYPTLPADAVKAKVEALCLDGPPADLIELAEPEAMPAYFFCRPLRDSEAFTGLLPSLRRLARGRAAAFLAKLRVRGWVDKANSTKGAPPRTALLAQRYSEQRQAIPCPEEPKHFQHPATRSYSRLFARRWRRALKGKAGKTRVQDEVAPQEKGVKAEGSVFFTVYRRRRVCLAGGGLRLWLSLALVLSLASPACGEA